MTTLRDDFQDLDPEKMSPQTLTGALRRKLILIPLTRRAGWLAGVFDWLRNRAPSAFSTATGPLLNDLLNDGGDRGIAAQLTNTIALGHNEFCALTKEADVNRDTRNFDKAELGYFKALRIFPLHSGYRVQYAHMLKEQDKFLDAVTQYWLALNVGAPIADVEEHLLFAARRAGISIGPGHVARSAEAWTAAEHSTSGWGLPPFETDLIDFADLFWGSRDYLNGQRIVDFLIRCRTRKDLLLAFIRAPETARHNRQLLLMLNRVGLAND